MKTACDIQMVGNSFGGRQGWAYIGNSGEIPVLKADLDAPQGYEHFHKYGGVRVVWQFRGHDNLYEGQLEWDDENGKPYWYIGGHGAFLSASFGYCDAMELIEASQMPIVKAGQYVAIAMFTSKSACVELFKVGRVDISCSTVAMLEPLNDDEMEEVKERAIRWLER